MKHIDIETASDYKQLIEELIEQGFVIQGVTIDGKRGVAKAFGDIPVQMCHFHQIAIIKRYLTSRPKLEASIELLKICRRIPTTTQFVHLQKSQRVQNAKYYKCFKWRSLFTA